jgi:hypothetical protein
MLPALVGAEAGAMRLMSPPAENVLPAPVKTMMLTSRSAARSSQTCSSSACISAWIALRLSAWFSVSVAMPASRWMSR